MTDESDPLDLLDVNSLLDDDDRLVRASVARFVDREVLPIIGHCFAEHRFPVELLPQLAELGVLGATLDGYGGAGLGPIAYGLICEELERGDSSLRSFVSVQSSLVMGAIADYGTEEQKQRWLPAMSSGQAVGAFALTEPQGGSDPASMETRARRAGSDWLLDGHKTWITNGAMADAVIVWARTEHGISAFIVERGMEGFTARAIERKLSLRASQTAELYFSSLRLPDGARLPGAKGLKAALSCLDQARYGIVWGAVGAARACLAEVLDYTAERQLFGRPLAHTQLIQVRMADCARRVAVARLLAHHLGTLKRQGRATAVQISLAKWHNVRMALDVARQCRDILGAAGITTEHVTMRHMMNLESVVTYEGTESIHQLVVGRALTGVSAF